MATLSQSLKDLFFSNNSQAGTSTSQVPLLDSSGNPIGSASIQKLAQLIEPYLNQS